MRHSQMGPSVNNFFSFFFLSLFPLIPALDSVRSNEDRGPTPRISRHRTPQPVPPHVQILACPPAHRTSARAPSLSSPTPADGMPGPRRWFHPLPSGGATVRPPWAAGRACQSLKANFLYIHVQFCNFIVNIFA
jgi:hypothetical protein